MFLKYLPKDADVSALVQLAIDVTQTALLRAYEIVEVENRTLTDDERRSLDASIFFDVAKSDAHALKMKSPHSIE